MLFIIYIHKNNLFALRFVTLSKLKSHNERFQLQCDTVETSNFKAANILALILNNE